MIDSLDRCVIFWATMKLESRRCALFEWRRFSSRDTSKVDRPKLMFPLIKDEDFVKGDTDLERPLI